MYRKQKNCVISFFLLLIFLLRGLLLLVIQYILLRVKGSSLKCLVVKFLYCLKKREISRLVGKLWRLDVIHCHSLPLVVSLCNALSLVVTLVVICCHSLSFVVTGCVTHCHWLSLDVPLASLFIKDHKKERFTIG